VQVRHSTGNTGGWKNNRCGARSAAGRMTALSLAPSVREHRFQMHHCLVQREGPTYELAV